VARPVRIVLRTASLVANATIRISPVRWSWTTTGMRPRASNVSGNWDIVRGDYTEKR
jgi:hypothetical protein